MKANGNNLGQIDCNLTIRLKEESTYWRKVLKCIVATVKAFASRGLSFRGHDETFGSPHNGNCLMSSELGAEFGPFLAEHSSRFGNTGS